MYTDAQKGILPLAGALIVPTLSYLIYRYSRKRLQVHEGSRSRSHLFYRIMTGMLLGQFLCHSFFKSTIYSDVGADFMAALVLLGWLTVECFWSLGRVCGPNKNVASPDMCTNEQDEDMLLDKEQVVQHDYVELTGLNKTTSAKRLMSIYQASRDERRRMYVLMLVFVVYICICIVDGFYLVYRNPEDEAQQATQIACFFLNKVGQTIIILGALSHARLHTFDQKRKRIAWWFGLSFLWATAVTLSTLPVLVNMDADKATDLVSNNVLCAFYSLSAGMLLWLVGYFRSLNPKDIDKKDTIKSLVVLILAASVSAVTGVLE